MIDVHSHVPTHRDTVPPDELVEEAQALLVETAIATHHHGILQGATAREPVRP